jgi:hypothetical protein
MGRCHGTLAPVRAGLQFIFLNTLRRDWDLLKKNRSPPPQASAQGARR